MKTQEMTDNEIRIAIAEACGWKRDWVTEEQSSRFSISMHSKAWFPPDDREWDELEPPDYPASLDAMAEALATLSSVQQVVFVRHLKRILRNTEGQIEDSEIFQLLCDRDLARTYALAFLATLNP